MKTFIGGFFTEYLNGIFKPSMNRLLGFLIGVAIVAISILTIVGMLNGKIKKEDIPNICLLLTTVSPTLLMLLGFSVYAKSVDLKSTTPNPNLPTSPVQQ